MKKIVYTVIFGSILVANAMAQESVSGLYLTQADFENNRLSYATNDANANNKVRFNEILGKPYINVRHNGEKSVIFKDDIFAYKKKNKIVRTHDFVSYDFIEKGVIWIYSKDYNVMLGKGVKHEKKYFYAVSGKDKIIPLTISNLKRSFPGKHQFHNFLEAQFRSDKDLASYNKLEKKFKVNSLLETTIFSSAAVMP